MADRAELLEATLECLPEGAALLAADCHVVFWNHAAQAITGYAALDVVGRPSPEGLRPLLEACHPSAHDAHAETVRAFAAHAQHKLGHEISAMARHLVLRDGLGTRIGVAVLFHPAECIDALPQGEAGEDGGLQASQQDLKEKLETLFEEFQRGGPVFGVLWITVDQAHDLRRTHGAGACTAMLEKVERALAHGLRPAEHLGSWGEDEFLAISHECTAALMSEHAQTLAGLARTADFRWWGDRVPLTVSIGAAQAETAGTLANLLERARTAMSASLQAGGDRVTAAPEEHSCSPL
jgi:diguanylate cyclase (GGDEF)-like protein/PAS domain S-box-containing protein